MILLDGTPLQNDHRYRGIGRYTGGLLEGMAQLESRPQIGVLLEDSLPEERPLAAGLLDRHGYEVFRVKRPRWRRSRLRWLFGRFGIRRAVEHSHAQLYHATDPNSVVPLRTAATIATIYDFIPFTYAHAASPMRRLDDRTGLALQSRLLRRADRLIAISEATKREAIDRLGVAPERIGVTHLAVDETVFFRRSPENIREVTARYGMRAPYFLYVGSADPHKNVFTLLRAFSAFMQDARSEHCLYLVGKWPAQSIAAMHAEFSALLDTGRVKSLGYVPDDDLAAMYSGAHAFVFPSSMEGFGLPLLEAMRCGTAILTSNCSSLPEVGGDAALYVDPRNVDELCWALRRLVEVPELRVGLVAQGLVRAGAFTWRSTARLTLKEYALVQ